MTQTFGRLLCTAAIGMALGSAAAKADMLDFEGGELTGSVFLDADRFTLGAYTLTTRHDYGTIDSASALGTQAPTGNASQFYFNSNSGALGIARSDGALFNLSSFSAAFVAQDPPSAQLTVIRAVGTRADSSTVSAWWSFASSADSHSPFSTYADPLAFAAFTSLSSVEFHACSIVNGTVCTEALMNNGQFAIDDIVVTAVPEPASVALFALGGLGLALRARCKLRSQA